jgi:hypothetical protein
VTPLNYLYFARDGFVPGDSLCRGSSVVERRPEKAGVASSILAPGTTDTATSLKLRSVPHSGKCDPVDVLGKDRSRFGGVRIDNRSDVRMCRTIKLRRF